MAMSIDATTNMTVVSNCDSSTGWATSESTYSGFQREGSNCLGTKVSQTTYHNYVTVSSTSLSNQRVYIWLLSNGQVDTKANGGFRIVIGDGTNRRAYYVGGSDDYGFIVGQWTCVMLDCGNLPTSYATLAGSSAPNLSAITQIGFGVKITSKALGTVDNVFFDMLRYGTGIVVTSSSGDDITLADIAADDASTSSGKAYGIIRELQPGVYGVQGDILLGNTSGGSIDFKDDTAIVVFEDRVHGAGTNTAFKFSGQHSSTGTFSLELGIAVDSGDDESGRGGVTFFNANPTGQPVDFDFSDSDIEDVFLYGCSFTGLQGTIDFSADATNGISHHLSGCSFSDCSQVDVGRVVVRNCIFSAYSPDTDGALLWNSNINIKNCKFLGNTDVTNDPHAIEHDTAGSFTYDNLTFSGNDYDINNTATATNTDSYTTQDSSLTPIYDTGTYEGGGQSFTGDGNKLTSVVLKLRKVGSPTGNAYVKLYAHSGTFGTSSVPTGAPLATSKAIDVSALQTTLTDEIVEFDDSEFYTLVNATKYVITIEVDTGVGDVSNYIELGYDAGGAHGGNMCTYNGTSWTAVAADDLYFYVRTGGDVTISAQNGADPSTAENTGTVPGVTNINNQVTLQLKVLKDSDGNPLQDAQCSIYLLDPPYTELMNEDSLATGIASEGYNYTVATDIKWRVRKSETSDDPRYIAESGTGQITANGFSQEVRMKENTFI